MSLLAELRSLVLPTRKGVGHDAAAVRAAEAALARLADERTAAVAALASASARRRELLLADGTDESISALEADNDRHHRVLERLELIEGELLAALQQARVGARRAAWQAIHNEWNASVPEFCAAMREATRQFNRLLALRTRANNEGFASEAAATLEPPPWVLTDPTLIDNFEVVAERRAEGAPALAPAPAPPVAARRVLPAPAPPPGPVRAKRTHPPAPVEGGVEVVVLRAGFEAADGTSCDAGEKITLPAEIARRAAEKGAVDYVRTPK